MTVVVKNYSNKPPLKKKRTVNVGMLLVLVYLSIAWELQEPFMKRLKYLSILESFFNNYMRTAFKVIFCLIFS